MRICMLGWEFPPFITGGLGTACYGLTRALDRLGHEVLFVLPRPVDRSLASHITLLSPDALVAWGRPAEAGASAPTPAEEWGAHDEGPSHAAPAGRTRTFSMPGLEHTRFLAVPARFSSPYPGGGPRPPASPDVRRRAQEQLGALRARGIELTLEELEDEMLRGGGGDWPPAPASPAAGGPGPGYVGDLFAEAERYARLVVALTRGQRFDVIHAHDWLTFPAGQALARVSGRPLVVHVHSTEFDRAGEHGDSRVIDIERRGMMAAMRVLAVSQMTRSICVRRYGVDESRVDVVYNGIDSEAAQPRPGDRLQARDRIVLFLGRITMQKGPEYFIAAARRVLEKVPDAKFLVAGSGDMAVRMIEYAASLGIGHRVLFTGFLRGADVERVYRMAECYVMPSVSEPFGIAPLEAMRHDVPVIISKQSGVAEVLTHALKVDFWDIDEMANKIVAVLRHPPLRSTLREHGSFELRRLTWDGAGERCVLAYQAAMAAQGRPRSGS